MRRTALAVAAALLAYAAFTVAMLTPEARAGYWAMLRRRPLDHPLDHPLGSRDD